MTDFTYRIEGMFALVLPESKAADGAMNELMRQTDGTAKVLVSQVPSLKADLHRAGFTIRKAAPEKINRAELDELARELGV